MVNAPSELQPDERRERTRSDGPSRALGAAPSLNPFGDLHVLQSLSARLARALKPVFEPFVRQSVRCWAEPIEVLRFGEYKAARKGALNAWVPLAITPGKCRALVVLDGGFALEMLDCFFGGDGEAPSPLPSEFSGSAEALIARLGQALAEPLCTAWEPLARIEFAAMLPEINYAGAPDVSGEEAMVATRFGIGVGDAKPVWLDILYPVAALKPYTPSLTAKVQVAADPEPQWQTGLTRAVMAVKLPVRCVLAEPVISLGKLAELKIGDVLPITFGTEAPIMVASRKLGTGTVGSQNGHAAIRLTSLERITEEDFR